MAKFVTKPIDIVVGRQQFRQLVVLDDKANAVKIQQEINNKDTDIDGILDLYEQGLETKYEIQFQGIIAIMNRVANLQSVAKNSFRDVTPKGEKVKEYEFKYQDLRVYAIKISNGKLVLLGGFKNRQSGDFSRFRSLKQQFLENQLM